MSNYVSCCVLAVPTANRAAYEKHAELAAALFKEYGALQVVECWGDDVPEGKITSFPKAVQLQAGETVVLSWIVWPSRDAWKKAEKDMNDDNRWAEIGNMPFDGKRLIFGNFAEIMNTA